MTGDELRAGPLTDGPSVGVDFDSEWTALTPAFTMDTSQQSWTDAHYEQHCAVTGRLRWDGEELSLHGTGLRDHSWGPRDFSRIGRHCWIHAQWPDGRSFMVFHHESGGHVLSHVTVDDGESAEGRLTAPAPLADTFAGSLSGYTLDIETHDGRTIAITASVEQAATLSMMGTSELGIGASPAASHFLVEAQTRFSWDGDLAPGLTERTIRRA